MNNNTKFKFFNSCVLVSSDYTKVQKQNSQTRIKSVTNTYFKVTFHYCIGFLNQLFLSKNKETKQSNYKEFVLLHGSHHVRRVQEPLSGRDAAQHLLAPTQLGRDHVGRVRVADAQVAEVHTDLRQKAEKPEKD